MDGWSRCRHVKDEWMDEGMEPLPYRRKQRIRMERWIEKKETVADPLPVWPLLP